LRKAVDPQNTEKMLEETKGQNQEGKP